MGFLFSKSEERSVEEANKKIVESINIPVNNDFKRYIRNCAYISKPNWIQDS